MKPTKEDVLRVDRAPSSQPIHAYNIGPWLVQTQWADDYWATYTETAVVRTLFGMDVLTSGDLVLCRVILLKLQLWIAKVKRSA